MYQSDEYRKLSGKTRTIGHKAPTPEQDCERTRQAHYDSGQDSIRSGIFYLRSCPIPSGFRGETQMKRLTTQVMCHPLVALAALYVTDLLMRSDSGLSGAIFVVAARSISKFVDAMRSKAGT
ncbi:hypothetical protein [Caballeronia temeraria]|nr:hypothetical protein [Caballeronia temeraria]